MHRGTSHHLRTLLISAASALLVLLPAASHAAAEDGSALIAGPGKGATVYYLSQEGKRYVFPNQKTYGTWFADFANVMEVASDELSSYPLGGNVRYRPGIRMIKITSDPRTYAVDSHGVLRWITSEDIARSLYGAEWNKKVDDVSDAFFVNYKMGEPLETVSDYSPEESAKACATIADDLFAVATPAAQTVELQEGDVSPFMPANFMRGQMLIDKVAAPTEAGANVLVVGSRGVTLGGFVFRGQNEEMRLRRVPLLIKNAGAVRRIALYDGETLVGEKTLDSVLASQPVNVDGFVIPKDGERTLTVKADLNAAGFSYGGEAPLSVTVSASNLDIVGTAPWSTTQITSLNQFNVEGSDLMLVPARATVQSMPLPSTALTIGDNTVARFKITAEGYDATALAGLVVKATCTFKDDDVAVSYVEQSSVRPVFGDRSFIRGSTYDAPCDSKGMTIDFEQDLVIAAGATKTLDVVLNLSAESIEKGGTIATAVSAATLLLKPADAGAPVAADALYVKGLPLPAQSLSKAATVFDPPKVPGEAMIQQ